MRTFANKPGVTFDSAKTTIIFAEDINALIGAPIINKTANYTLALTDAGETLEMNNGSARTITVPPNSSVAFPVGTEISVLAQGAGDVTIVAGSGVTLLSSDLKIDGQGKGCVLKKRATNEWYVIGALTT